MIRRPPRSTPLYSSAASDVYKRQVLPITAASCAEFDVRLSRLERQDGALTASLVMVPHGVLEGEISGESVVLRDKAGKEYPAIVTEGTPGNESETPYQLTFPSAPEHQEFTEIQIRIPTEVHRERLDVDLKDLNLK